MFAKSSAVGVKSSPSSPSWPSTPSVPSTPSTPSAPSRPSSPSQAINTTPTDASIIRLKKSFFNVVMFNRNLIFSWKQIYLDQHFSALTQYRA
ncbi:MAG: hypothetical protein CMF37_08740 [Leeuwenhoekiella sp.]|nr:hypothetical protein [Leeuwenhoekiella sp.]HAX14994.1 hypothetical protein [Leeuwenhoekiella sp.]